VRGWTENTTGISFASEGFAEDRPVDESRAVQRDEEVFTST
jgi:hypothetical protein